jgi:hypothetical protein
MMAPSFIPRFCSSEHISLTNINKYRREIEPRLILDVLIYNNWQSFKNSYDEFGQAGAIAPTGMSKRLFYQPPGAAGLCG